MGLIEMLARLLKMAPHATCRERPGERIENTMGSLYTRRSVDRLNDVLSASEQILKSH